MIEDDVDLLKVLKNHYHNFNIQWIDVQDVLPKQPGLYILTMRLESAKTIQVGAKGFKHFAAGNYLYVGSAKGAGGLAARVGRHFSQSSDKNKRWHIDYIRQPMTLQGCWIITEIKHPSTYSIKNNLSNSLKKRDVTECGIVKLIANNKSYQIIEGFGSSDCRCSGHVLYRPM